MQELHESYMRRCITLAQQGEGHVAPNPLVGAVLVHENRIIGEGWHQAYGGPHAEVHCINSVQPKHQHLIASATLYVSLEPCAHYGKTPPCSLLILQKGIRKVVIGCRDPFNQVNGKGIEQLQQAGVDVITGVLEKECRFLNRRFFFFHEHQQPYIILKWAQTANGFMGSGTKERLLISDPVTNRLVHKWRAEESAILVGSRTALLDNPALTNRHWPGQSPLRMVIDRQLQLPTSLQIFQDGNPTLVFNCLKQAQEGPIQYIQLQEHDALLPQIIQYCYQERILSVLVEGGQALLNLFLEKGYWNEIRRITSPQPVNLEAGVLAPVLPQQWNMERIQSNGDYIHIIYNPAHA